MSLKLIKSLSFIDAVAIVAGSVIGSGIFLKPGIVLNNAGSSYMGLLAWLVGGIVTLASVLTIAEVASAIPKTGGLYVYLEELFGDVWGFMLGWAQTTIVNPATVAAVAIAFATFSTFFIPMDGMHQKFLAAGLMIFLVMMNIIATKLGGIIQTAALIGKLLPIIAIVIFGLALGNVHDFSMVNVGFSGAGFGVAILGTLWAYEGWINVTYIAEELKDPSRQVPRALIIGIGIVIAAYLLMNTAMLNALPASSIIGSSRPASDVAVALFGIGGAAFITIGIMISTLGTVNGFVLSGARIPLTMGQRGQYPFSRILSKIHPLFKTPTNALIFQGVVAFIYIMSGTFNILTDLLIFVIWIFYTMGVMSIFILRKHPIKYKPSYKVPLYPLTPLIGILGGVYILFSTVSSQPVNSLIGIGITFAGVPIFYYLRRARASSH